MVKLDKYYTDPRLVELYDIENRRGPDTDFYLDLAAEAEARIVFDLGCGTGLLTRELAIPSRQVTGVDPSAAMLAYARRQPGAERVRWVEGDASALGRPEADLLVMTGNVAQIFLEDEEWRSTLGAIHGALRMGGMLAFESRNPDDRGWERWNREATLARFDTPNGPMETWLELVSARNNRVKFEGHNVFLATGEAVVAESELRFRSMEEIRGSLREAGFEVKHVDGDWKKGPLVPTSRVMIFIARKA